MQPQRKRWRDVLTQDGGERAQARLIRQETLNRVMGKAVVKNSSGNPVAALCLEHARQIGA